MLKALFSAYPDGRPGLALLILRGSLGVALIVQGALCVAESWRGLVALFAGALLLAGFLTPVIATLTALIAGAAALWPIPNCSSLFEAKMTLALCLVILAAVTLLGPGAFSIDARLFGRREIIIPSPLPPR